MKKIILFIILFTSTCYSGPVIPEHEKVKILYHFGYTRDHVGYDYQIVCIEGIKYIVATNRGISITPMINDKGKPCKCK